MAASIRESLSILNVSLHSQSDLHRMLVELEAMAKSPDPSTQWGVPLIEQTQRLANALMGVRRVPGASEKVHSCQNQLNRLETLDSKAQDTLFEIEIAGRLSSGGLAVALTEPDVVATVPGFGDVSLACKRPRSKNGIRKRLGQAATQITQRGRPGVIVMGVEALLHPPKTVKGLTKPTLWIAETNKDLAEMGSRVLQAIHEEMAPVIARDCSRPLVVGIAWVGVIAGRVREPLSYASHWLCLTIENPEHPQSPGLMRRVGETLFRGSD